MLNLHLFGAAPVATSSGPVTVQEAVKLNLQSPIILAFVFGNVLTMVRSEFKFPEALYQSLVIYLLLGTGLEGESRFPTPPFHSSGPQSWPAYS